MTAQCHTALWVSPHQPGRETERDGEKERERVDRDKKVRDLSQAVRVCVRLSLSEDILIRQTDIHHNRELM